MFHLPSISIGVSSTMSTTQEHGHKHDHGHGPFAHLHNFMNKQPFATVYHWHMPSSVRHMSLIGIIVLVVGVALTHLGITNALRIGVGVALLLHLPIIALTLVGSVLRRARA